MNFPTSTPSDEGAFVPLADRRGVARRGVWATGGASEAEAPLALQAPAQRTRFAAELGADRGRPRPGAGGRVWGPAAPLAVALAQTARSRLSSRSDFIIVLKYVRT